MPTDLQIIDDLEKLRIAFAQANTEFVAGSASNGFIEELETAEERVAASWLTALNGRQAVNAEARRVLRARVRGLVADEGFDLEGLHQFTSDLSKATAAQLVTWNGKFKEVLAQAARQRLWPLDNAAPARSPGEEAAAWRRLLPGLSGLGAWRFLRQLGRPVLVAEPPLRRFFWRYGLLERAGENNSKHVDASLEVHSAFERMQELSGMSAETLALLLRWHAVGDREWTAGGVCRKTPLCGACPMRGGCTWGQYHSANKIERATGEAAQEQLRHAREELMAGRQADLHETELLALLLQGGAPGQNALELASELLRRMGGLRALERASMTELQEVRGIAPGRALALKSALELGRRFANEGMRPGDPFTCGADVWRAYRGRFQHLPQEHFVIILLDTKNRVILDQIISKGTLTGSLAHPREVFQPAVRHSAASVILLHNHPSGDPTPSADDFSITKRLKEAGEILGIKVLDHIILGAEKYYSFKEEE